MVQVKWKVALYGRLGRPSPIPRLDSNTLGPRPVDFQQALFRFIGEILGIKAAPIEYRAQGKQRSLTIRGIADAEIEGLPSQDGKDITISNHPFAAVRAIRSS
jgi:hypothetical protein